MMLLHCVIREMDKLIVEIFHVELLGSSSYVAILEPIAFLMSVDARQANVASNVKFPLLVKERHDVLLHYVGSRTA